VARSQQQTSDQVTALAQNYSSLAKQVSAQDTNVNPEQLAPDTRPLAGAQDLSLGTPALMRSFWQTLFGLALTFDTNPLIATHENALTTWTSAFGGIDMHRISRGSELNLNYLGGTLAGNNSNAGNSLIQELQLSEKLTRRHTAVSFLEQLNYLPEAAFGSDLSGGLSFPDAQGLSLQPVLTPNQSILTSRSQRISQSFVTEVDRFLTPRSSVTFVGSYSLLRFVDNGFLNSGEALFQAGYNYQLTSKDTVALLYRFTALRFSNSNQSINGHVAQVAYGRRITGQLALHLAAGPEFASFRTPISTSTGAPGGSTTTTSSSTAAYWSWDSSITYRRQHTELALTYDRSVSAGAGILAGAITNQMSGSINSRLSPTLKGEFVLGYARNQGLNVTPQAPAVQSYNYWFSGVNLSHDWGHWTTVFLHYQLQFQNSNASFCVGMTCAPSFVRHTISIGFGWRPRPISML